MADTPLVTPIPAPFYAPLLVRSGDLDIQVTCRGLPWRGGFRLEVRLQAAGKTAIIDIVDDGARRLEVRILEAASLFARSLHLSGAPTRS